MGRLKTISESIKMVSLKKEELKSLDEAVGDGPKSLDMSQFKDLPDADAFFDMLSYDEFGDNDPDKFKLASSKKNMKRKHMRPGKMGSWYENAPELEWLELPADDDSGYKYMIQTSDFDYEEQLMFKSLDMYK